MISSFLFLIGYFFITKISAEKFKCGKDLKVNYCIFTNEEEDAIYVKPCKKGEQCKSVRKMIDDASTVQCVETKRTALLKEGDSCISSSECESTICNDGKCIYLEDYFNYCDNDNQCGLNSFCNNVCLPIYKSQQKCDVDSHCEIGFACGSINEETTKRCLPMYSLQEGAITDNNLLCKSGYIIYNKDTKHKVCASLAPSNTTCDEYNNCKFIYESATYTDTITVDCKADNDNVYQCPLGKGWNSYVALFNEEVKKFNGKGVKITNVNRFHLGNDKLIKAYAYYLYEANIKPDSQDENDICLNEFWYQQVGNNAFNIRVSFGLLLLSLLLL